MQPIKLFLSAAAAIILLSACHSSKKAATLKPYKILKKELTMADVSRRNDTVRVVFPEVGMFDFGKDEVKSDARPYLSRTAEVLKQYSAIQFIINGYTDNVGTDDVNNDLSKRRADHVQDMMRALGITDNRMNTAGMGSKNPVMANTTDAGRQANRRVEFLMFVPGM